MAVADGVVTSRAYTRGGGNTLKIKHSQGLVSGYLHLRGFARGIVVGSRVSQGDIIGYVGSTGLSTGPHLDFRIWTNGTPIDPLKVPSTPTEPVNKASFERFTAIRDSVIAVLNNQRSFDILNENMLKSTAPADSTVNQPAQ
jgi:murein DD-endopeptidase MepM/ murein hydrolase activator NlpD